VNEFERAAWEKRQASTEHPPSRALAAALDDIGKANPDEPVIQAVVVLTTRHKDGDVSVSTYQAGQYDTFGIIGSLSRAIRILDEGAE